MQKYVKTFEQFINEAKTPLVPSDEELMIDMEYYADLLHSAGAKDVDITLDKYRGNTQGISIFFKTKIGSIIRLAISPQKVSYKNFHVDKLLKAKPKDYTDYEPIDYNPSTDTLGEPPEGMWPDWSELSKTEIIKGFKKIVLEK